MTIRISRKEMDELIAELEEEGNDVTLTDGDRCVYIVSEFTEVEK